MAMVNRMGSRVVDADIAGIVERCRRYWISTRVPEPAAADMAAELAVHLREAAAEGKTPDSVVGADELAFAEAWAREHRRPAPPRPVRTPAAVGPSWVGLAAAAVAVAVVVTAVIAGPKEDSMDVEVMQWIWVGAMVVLAVGEMVTAGFFLLPFAVGAGAAAIVAFAGIAVPVQFLVMIAVSIVTLVLIQRYVRREDERKQPVVGANRYVSRTALVLEPVSRVEGTGRVRLDTEDWRATTDHNDVILPGSEVVIVDVRGTRLVVEPLEL